MARSYILTVEMLAYLGDIHANRPRSLCEPHRAARPETLRACGGLGGRVCRYLVTNHHNHIAPGLRQASVPTVVMRSLDSCAAVDEHLIVHLAVVVAMLDAPLSIAPLSHAHVIARHGPARTGLLALAAREPPRVRIARLLLRHHGLRAYRQHRCRRYQRAQRWEVREQFRPGPHFDDTVAGFNFLVPGAVQQVDRYAGPGQVVGSRGVVVEEHHGIVWRGGFPEREVTPVPDVDCVILDSPAIQPSN